MMEKCKYRLPCGRCDKFDTLCDFNKDAFISKDDSIIPDPNKCDHDWVLTDKYNFSYTCIDGEEVTFRSNKYVCNKCKSVDVREA